ncbi:uncharacterized protein L3040_002926 [Drepanopeziza brunnea f. sp. 'multigermtubi']|uniref:uncharacterized protein n=1 Tax=Drepanopeziza brunnea f. sp. 'multigermtubi' TaxID=698441 RepID=UPI00238CA08E|nr:hypothetical protein L3040_002926 [Drepanopeziza brunnea f. sp. 'multigermtubi']
MIFVTLVTISWLYCRLFLMEAFLSRTPAGAADIRHEFSPAKILDPDLVHLHLTLISLDFEANPNSDPADLLPGLERMERHEISALLDRIPSFENSIGVQDFITPPNTPSQELLRWICQTVGQDIVEDRYSREFPDFAGNVRRFVIRPPRHEKRPLDSKFLSHGTSLGAYRSIMRQGFKPATDLCFGAGLFMAEEPRTAAVYALYKDFSPENVPRWKIGRFETYGLVLCCKVAGPGRPVRNDNVSKRNGAKIHVILKLESVVPR